MNGRAAIVDDSERRDMKDLWCWSVAEVNSPDSDWSWDSKLPPQRIGNYRLHSSTGDTELSFVKITIATLVQGQ